LREKRKGNGHAGQYNTDALAVGVTEEQQQGRNKREGICSKKEGMNRRKETNTQPSSGHSEGERMSSK